ncbi:class I SAM-dependent methyltransferase [Nocardia fusca]|uniref:class I SAM-dependent methyltransferase n=1 Tax=Nocardia fusca TaxID=941183 RepID=UPI0037C7CAC9
MRSDQRARTPMFIDEAETGLVLSGLRRYNLFTAVFFLGRQRLLLRELADHSGVRPGEDALDIGCGPGKLVRVLGRRVGQAGSVTGVDPSEEAIAHNRLRNPRHRYVRSTAQELDLPDAAFDVITCTFVMHHIPERHRKAALAEMWRVLKPGGRLLLADTYLSERLRGAYVLTQRLRRRKHGDPAAAVDVRQYAATLRALGFTAPDFVPSRHRTAMLLTTKPRGAFEPGQVRADPTGREHSQG